MISALDKILLLRKRALLGQLAAMSCVWLLMGIGLASGEPASVAGNEAKTQFLFQQGSLVMTAEALRDSNGSFSLGQLPNPEPKCKVELKGDVTPLTARLLKIALDDVEHNMVTSESGAVYFGAGNQYGLRIYERDIAVSGVLGLNHLYPEVMLSSLKVAREIRKDLGYKVSAPHVVQEIDVPWEVIAQVDKAIMAKYRTNSYTRRTDDVAWLWAVDDLFTLHSDLADWTWVVENGEYFFKVFYDPWFDKTDGLFRGQPLFHDIQSSAYPKGMTIADCVLLKALSTNCLYYRGMQVMAKACEKSGRPAAEKQHWMDRASTLKVAIQKEFTQPDRTLAYYKDRHGKIMLNREILGTAFAAIFGIVEGDAAKAVFADYPMTENGIPLFSPFILGNSGPHNMASWPFCDTFFLWGKSIAEGKDYTDYNAALLARSIGTSIKSKKGREDKAEVDGFGSFHEYITLPDGLITGSGRQLWSAAAFLNVFIRAGLISEKRSGQANPTKNERESSNRTKLNVRNNSLTGSLFNS